MALHLLVVAFCGLGNEVRESRNTANRIELKLEAVEVIQHDHIEWRRRGSLFFISAHMNVVVIVAAIREFVDQSRIAVIRKDHGLVGSKDCVEILVLQAVRMFFVGLQRHQVDDVYNANANVGNVLS